jgi:sialic acid synthase
MRELEIAGKRVADDTPAYVVAEVGHNHEGKLEKAEELFREAAVAGANAVKLQKRDNRSLFTKAMFTQPYESRNSYGPTYGTHREALEFDRFEYLRLLEVSAELGIAFFSTAFDMPSVDFLTELEMPVIKIASADVTNTPLLSYAAQTGKTLIVSTGGADMDDVRRACDTILPVNPNLALLQCTAIYPAMPGDLNLSVIGTYRSEYPDTVIGYSGHDLGPELSCIGYALGARLIEKHFTLDHSRPGSDHHFSLDPAQLTELVAALDRTQQAIGSPVKVRSASEARAITKMGKKLVAAHDLPTGHVLSERDVAFKSPGDGMKPYRLLEVLGRATVIPLKQDDDISLSVLADANEDAAVSRTWIGSDVR